MVMQATDDTLRIAIDIVKPKKVLMKTIGTNQHCYTLPDGLPSFQRLADERIATQQKINPELFTKCHKTRYITMKNEIGTTNSRVIRKFVRIPVKPNNKVFNVDKEPNQNFLINTDPKDLQWMIISTSEETLPNLNITIRRTCTFRDPHGVAT
jgi:hypothetical protein